MSKHRKTFRVNSLVSHANRILAATSSTPEARRAVANLLESVLEDHDCYNGFRYLPSELDENGQYQKGISDETRRHYYDPSS